MRWTKLKLSLNYNTHQRHICPLTQAQANSMTNEKETAEEDEKNPTSLTYKYNIPNKSKSNLYANSFKHELNMG